MEVMFEGLEIALRRRGDVRRQRTVFRLSPVFTIYGKTRNGLQSVQYYTRIRNTAF